MLCLSTDENFISNCRDIINLICEHLELYRACQSQIGKEHFFNLLPDQRDSQLKSALESEKKLHPALFSAASEHKVGPSLYVLPSVVINGMHLADGQGTTKRLIVIRPIKWIFVDDLMFLLLYIFIYIQHILSIHNIILMIVVIEHYI
jgi:hypothetical protein